AVRHSPRRWRPTAGPPPRPVPTPRAWEPPATPRRHRRHARRNAPTWPCRRLPARTTAHPASVTCPVWRAARVAGRRDRTIPSTVGPPTRPPRDRRPEVVPPRSRPTRRRRSPPRAPPRPAPAAAVAPPAGRVPARGPHRATTRRSTDPPPPVPTVPWP